VAEMICAFFFQELLTLDRDLDSKVSLFVLVGDTPMMIRPSIISLNYDHLSCLLFFTRKGRDGKEEVARS
jgi:hypothetical protein